MRPIGVPERKDALREGCSAAIRPRIATRSPCRNERLPTSPSPCSASADTNRYSPAGIDPRKSQESPFSKQRLEDLDLTHLLIALGAAGQDRRVRDITTAALANEFVKAADHKEQSRFIGKYAQRDLLCLDEVGSVQFDNRGAELLFQIITAREEQASIACASNAPFSDWDANSWSSRRSRPQLQ